MPATCSNLVGGEIEEVFKIEGKDSFVVQIIVKIILAKIDGGAEIQAIIPEIDQYDRFFVFQMSENLKIIQ